MAWDFETDPEFEAQLAVDARRSSTRELIPLEPILRELTADGVGAGEGATCRSR